MMLALLLGGCWPYIPGTWEDYAVPEGTQLMGLVEWVAPLGDYWSDGTAYGTAFWGWLPDLDTEHRAWDLGYVTAGCTAEPADTAWFDKALGQVDDETSLLAGAPDIELEWKKRAARFEAEMSEEPTGTYQLEPFHVDGETYAGVDSLVMPAPVDWDTTLLDGDEPQTVRVEDLAKVSWAPRDDEELFAIVRLLVVQGSSAVETLRCGAPLADGQIQLDTNLLTTLDEADYVILMLGVGRETEAEVAGAGTTSLFLGARHVEGAVYIK